MSDNRCTRCLLREFDKESYVNNIKGYILNLEDEVKADDTLYEERLKECKNCDYLLEGMCRACGCYVELRAVIINNTCPYSKW